MKMTVLLPPKHKGQMCGAFGTQVIQFKPVIKSLVVISLLFLTLPVMAFPEVGGKLFLWTDSVPGETSPKKEPTIVEDRGDGVLRLTDITNPLLEVFVPRVSESNHTGIIVCPGGGYRILAIDKEGYEIAEWLTGLGYTAFVLQYRVPNKRDRALQDVQRAIRLVRSQAKNWKIDPDKIGLLGFSAGAHLAVKASTAFDQETYKKTDDADDLSSRPGFAVLIYPGLLDQGENKTLSPDIQIQKNTPSMFVFGTADDFLWHSNLVIAAALKEAGIAVELHLMPEGGHGYGMRAGNPAAETWPGLVEKWLTRID